VPHRVLAFDDAIDHVGRSLLRLGFFASAMAPRCAAASSRIDTASPRSMIVEIRERQEQRATRGSDSQIERAARPAAFEFVLMNIVVVIAVVLWLLSAFGVLGSLESIHIGR
jgi:hypothetical protein